jgi:pimeloyl-ACP methyl ester carboxylesterase
LLTNLLNFTHFAVGFGGSLDQFTGFASELSEGFTVISFDSLGFGYSEKPPLSYNQYLWRCVQLTLILLLEYLCNGVLFADWFLFTSYRDQVVDFILRECEERGETNVVLMGNSIGGFTVASVAAALAVLHQEGKTAVQCNGLVLMNSAGLTVEIIVVFQDHN